MACTIVLLSSSVTPVRAAGTVTIQHKGGTLETYNDVAIKVIHGVLYVCVGLLQPLPKIARFNETRLHSVVIWSVHMSSGNNTRFATPGPRSVQPLGMTPKPV